jgi:hypothetical protein
MAISVLRVGELQERIAAAERMNGVDTGGAFDRVIIFWSECSKYGTTETRTDARLDGIGGQQAGQSMHLPLNLDAND